MEILPGSYFVRKYKKFVKKHPQLSSKIDEKLEIFKENQNHPSLRLHKLTGSKSNTWSISIDVSIRILLIFSGTL